MSDAKIKVIIKRPDEKAGHVTNISASLKNLQKTVLRRRSDRFRDMEAIPESLG